LVDVGDMGEAAPVKAVPDHLRAVALIWCIEDFDHLQMLAAVIAVIAFVLLRSV
jgi:hypothetical protein